MADLNERIDRVLMACARDGKERETVDYGSYRETIMLAVEDAIDKPGESPRLDTTLVRAMLGKRGARAVTAPPLGAAVAGDKRVEFAPDPAIEIYCRVYAIEREQSDASTARAMAAAAAATFPARLIVREDAARGA